VRESLRTELAVAIEQWSYTDDERTEPSRAGLAEDDAAFDDALGEIWRAQEELVARDLAERDAARRKAGPGGGRRAGS
jgi:hypothetical protein